ncbi:secretion system type I outer membrane efflux pump lipoprotein NodT [Gluconacetobacter johannae DSM 13595]|uniref:Efflux transporter outer membrane subunit n=1 Tax=Gluconacetobacter johannae TaxID=112140 RepID=A0A7W4J8Z2_9PROT|nr:efflux transporter outer membrane subunit [Gluconacetobacter johannae]MBB2176794.1 efflux transporter outer membrane subunit [Gluconacetobacter johannae]GBQ83992.1 secretion system type I outer membrane efflux pump lipoprotein NodT [Gluconacetobacter johannae DSM 13595]
MSIGAGDGVEGDRGPVLVRRGYSWRAAVVGLSVVATGCAVGPDFHKPAPWTPPHWTGPGELSATRAPKGPVTSDIVDTAPDPAWWDVFHDAELSALERRVASENLSVAIATARLAQSRSQLRIAGAERYPGLSAAGSYTRSQYSTKTLQRIISEVGKSQNLQLDGANLSDLSGQFTIPLLDQWRDSIDATWEVDLWGRVRRQYEAASADLDSSVEERRGVLTAQMAEVARDYVALREAQAQLHILMDNRDTAAHTLELSQQRNSAGLVTELDVQSAQSQLDAVSARIPQMEQQIAVQVNALSLLLGAPPAALAGELLKDTDIPPVPPRVPAGLPSELARRRPDIRQAEAQLHAATAQVGEAVAEFYPRVTIDAGFGFQSLSFRDLGFWNARAWNVGPSITLPIFQGGRLRGQLELRKAAQQEAAISYRRTVLGAWHEVDNALTAYRDEQARHDSLARQVAADGRSLDLARDQYRHGMVTFLTVLDAERRVLGAQTDLTASTATLSTDLVQLYAALGGGWETTFPDRPATHAARVATLPQSTAIHGPG